MASTTTTGTSTGRRANVVEFAEDPVVRLSRANSISSAASVLSVAENKDCDYLKLVMGFKRTLMLPDVFFAGDSFGCFCEGCAPSLQCTMVSGWVRFKINQQTLNSSCDGRMTGDDSVWTTAYYNARVEKIRSVLDHGQPLPIGEGSLETTNFSILNTCSFRIVPIPAGRYHSRGQLCTRHAHLAAVAAGFERAFAAFVVPPVHGQRSVLSDLRHL